MITIRKSDERGHIEMGWLNTYHTFSFSDYHDEHWMHFRMLRVMNEDRIAPNQGFGMHPHRDMEIITYVLSGEIQHTDSMGNFGIIKAGDVQRMSAGMGIFHSEVNPSDKELYLYQIWIFPKEKNVTPTYEQKRFEDSEKKNQLRLIASTDGTEGSVTIGQDAKVFAAMPQKGMTLTYPITEGRGMWLQTISGALSVNTISLGAGDAVAVEDEKELIITADEDSHFLLFDLG